MLSVLSKRLRDLFSPDMADSATGVTIVLIDMEGTAAAGRARANRRRRRAGDAMVTSTSMWVVVVEVQFFIAPPSRSMARYDFHSSDVIEIYNIYYA